MRLLWLIPGYFGSLYIVWSWCRIAALSDKYTQNPSCIICQLEGKTCEMGKKLQ